MSWMRKHFPKSRYSLLTVTNNYSHHLRRSRPLQLPKIEIIQFFLQNKFLGVMSVFISVTIKNFQIFNRGCTWVYCDRAWEEIISKNTLTFTSLFSTNLHKSWEKLYELIFILFSHRLYLNLDRFSSKVLNESSCIILRHL